MCKNTKKLYRIHVEVDEYMNAVISFIYAGYHILDVRFAFDPSIRQKHYIVIFYVYGDMSPDEAFSDNIDAITTDGKNVIFYNWH